MKKVDRIKKTFKEGGELGVVQSFIKSKDTVFDIGSNIGFWSRAVLEEHFDVKVHMFEPAKRFLTGDFLIYFQDMIDSKQVFVNNCAVSDTETEKDFFLYPHFPDLSTLYPRGESVLKKFKIAPPEIIKVPTVTVDSYCKRNGIDHINFLKIDVEGSEFDVIKGTSDLLSKGQIDYIQFEYGGCFKDANITFKDIYEYLTSRDYNLFKIRGSIVTPTESGMVHMCCALEIIKRYLTSHEDLVLVNYLAIRENLLG